MSSASTKLSLAMIAKNEARCLARSLNSVQAVVQEMVVVDTGSSDDTVRIAREFGAKVTHFDWINDFSAARNFALSQTSGDWILVLDADEYASEPLKMEISQFVGARHAIGRLKIVSDFRRNGQSLCSQSFVSRLFPRGAHFEGRIHEQLSSTLPRLNLKGELWHDGYLETGKTERNIKLLAGELDKTPGNAYLLFQLALEYTSLNQTQEACRCLEQAFSRLELNEPFAPNVIVDYLYTLMELKRFETGLEVIEKAAKIVDDFPDFHLVCGLFYMNLIRSNATKYVAFLPRIEASFKRSLTLGETDKYKSVKGSGTFLAQYNLGTLYHVFGNTEAARCCFQKAADSGYKPAIQILQKHKP